LKPNILIVTSNYWPEPTGIAVYTTDLAQTLQTKGYRISVLTSLPHYPWWKVPSEFKHINEGTGNQNGVLVSRAKHLVPSKMNALVRMRFEASLWWNLRRVSKNILNDNFDAVIACIPTVAAGIVGRKIARFHRIPFGLIVQDLSGAGAKQSGLPGGAVISKIAHYVEGRALYGAGSVVVVSGAMRDVVLSLGLPQSRITQITNYSARQISSIDKTSARSRFGWA